MDSITDCLIETHAIVHLVLKCRGGGTTSLVSKFGSILAIPMQKVARITINSIIILRKWSFFADGLSCNWPGRGQNSVLSQACVLHSLSSKVIDQAVVDNIFSVGGYTIGEAISLGEDLF
jgi:hypothetical protein